MFLRVLLKQLKVKTCVTICCVRLLCFLFALKYAMRYPYDLLVRQSVSSGIQTQLLLYVAE
jgi:hypothetical protein